MRYFAQTDTGSLRRENQDAFGVNADKNIYFVCDGMGGGAAGDFASKCAVDTVLKSVNLLTDDGVRSIIGADYGGLSADILRPVAAIRLANRMLHNLTQKYSKLAGMGTTLAMVFFDKASGLAHIYHVGDSRVYRLRGGILTQLTKDHSKITELIDEGKMTADEAKTAEIQSMITRALGTASNVKVDYKTDIVKAKDIYLICSDGLNGELDDNVIADIININKADVKSVPSELIISANNAGGRDNITAVVMIAEDDGTAYTGTPHVSDAVLTIPAETSAQSAIEDKFLSRHADTFNVEVPKSAKEKSIFNPVIMAIIAALLVTGIVFVYSIIPRPPDKEFSELTGKFTGMNLQVRTINADYLARIDQTYDKVYKLELLADAIKNPELYTSPLENVQITVEDKIPQSPNKFLGLSGASPLEIRLPAGSYVLTATYPGYKIFDEALEAKDNLNINLEMSGALRDITIIMMPQNMEG
jgi:protein phosphatase